MTRSLRSLAAGLTVSLAGLALLLTNSSPIETASARVLEARGELTWYRGNLHTHSLWSDGDEYLESIALWYREHDYDFLCITDHNVLSQGERWIDVEKSRGGREAYRKLKERFSEEWIEERRVDGRLQVRLKTFEEVADRIAVPDEFLFILGEEITDRFGKKPVHLNATNLQEVVPPQGGESVYEVMQNNVDAVRKRREKTGEPILVHLNHPNYGYAVTAEDLMRVRGENFFEVYNGHRSVNDSGNAQHASTDRMWDIMLTRRLAELDLPLMYGLAVDDAHNYHRLPGGGSNPGRGWVMVLAEDLSPESLIAAMERGRFYASTGVTLEKVVSSSRGQSIVVDTEPGVEYTIEFVGTRRGFDAESEPVTDEEGNPVHATGRYSDEIGKVLKKTTGPKAIYEFTGDELYVRARIVSSRKHPNPSERGDFERAWTQPVRGPAAPEQP